MGQVNNKMVCMLRAVKLKRFTLSGKRTRVERLPIHYKGFAGFIYVKMIHSGMKIYIKGFWKLHKNHCGLEWPMTTLFWFLVSAMGYLVTSANKYFRMVLFPVICHLLDIGCVGETLNCYHTNIWSWKNNC